MHATEVKTASGQGDPTLVEARCECGWRGPVRDFNTPTGLTLANLDARDHADSKGSDVPPRPYDLGY